jgi:hypothetical protein
VEILIKIYLFILTRDKVQSIYCILIENLKMLEKKNYYFIIFYYFKKLPSSTISTLKLTFCIYLTVIAISKKKKNFFFFEKKRKIKFLFLFYSITEHSI